MFSQGALARDASDGRSKKRVQAMDEAMYYPCSPGSQMKNRQGVILNRDTTVHYGSHGHRSRKVEATRTKYRPLSANMERLATPKSVKTRPEKPKTPLWVPSGRVDPNKFSPYKSMPGYTDDASGAATYLHFTASLRTPLSTPNRRPHRDIDNPKKNSKMPQWFNDYLDNRRQDMARDGFVFQQPNIDSPSSDDDEEAEADSTEMDLISSSNPNGVTTKTPLMSFDTFVADMDEPETTVDDRIPAAKSEDHTVPMIQHLQSLLDPKQREAQQSATDPATIPSILETEDVDDIVDRVTKDEMGRYEPLQRLLYIQYCEEVQQADRLQNAVDEVFAARESNDPAIEQIMSELETLTAQAMSLRYTHMEQALEVFRRIGNDEDVEDDMFGHVDDGDIARNSPLRRMDDKVHLQGRLTALKLDADEHKHLMQMLEEDCDHARETIKALEKLDEHKPQADQYRLSHMRDEWNRIQVQGDNIADQVLQAQANAESKMV
eukprot:m.255271 g.255271  ORF g.255271 m.255271 type:complete len:492 (+) comp19614_c0_seq1:114-1589(+)